MNDVRKLLISIAEKSSARQARGEAVELTPEVIAGFILREKGDDAELFARRVAELVASSSDEHPRKGEAYAPAPAESRPVRKRGPLRLVK